AVALYQHEQQREEDRQKKKSLWKVCQQIQDEHWAKTKKTVKLDCNMLRRLVNGGTPKSISNSSKGLLLPEEVNIIINYAIEIASHGFLLSHGRLREHVNEICRAQLGVGFSEKGVGRCWTSHFIEKHSDCLSMYWAHPLDNAHGCAVNPTTNKQWFDLLETVLAGGVDSLNDQ
ncbi:hypothetical protein L208DRAFT_1029613, partial [Tricholoma matsutake]